MTPRLATLARLALSAAMLALALDLPPWKFLAIALLWAAINRLDLWADKRGWRSCSNWEALK